jgi:hypothetical protein
MLIIDIEIGQLVLRAFSFKSHMTGCILSNIKDMIVTRTGICTKGSNLVIPLIKHYV